MTHIHVLKFLAIFTIEIEIISAKQMEKKNFSQLLSLASHLSEIWQQRDPAQVMENGGCNIRNIFSHIVNAALVELGFQFKFP